jgi:hypothetical protein
LTSRGQNVSLTEMFGIFEFVAKNVLQYKLSEYISSLDDAERERERDEWQEWRQLHNEKLHNLQHSSFISNVEPVMLSL